MFKKQNVTKMMTLILAVAFVFTAFVSASADDATYTTVGYSDLEGALSMRLIARYKAGNANPDGGIAEIVAYNSDNGKLYLVNGVEKTLDIVDISAVQDDGSVNLGPEEQNLISDKSIDLAEAIQKVAGYETFEYGDLTSVAVNTAHDIVAVAVQAAGHNDNGLVAVLNYDGEIQQLYPAGKQPDMIIFAGNDTILTADEGEPREGYSEGATDPAGSVTVIDLNDSDPVKASTQVGFEDFDGQELPEFVLTKEDALPSVDFEPEYIALVGNFAYVTLQENNAIAVLDIAEKKFVSLKGLEFIDHSEVALDLIKKGKEAVLKTEPGFFGVPMPDGIAATQIGDKTYVLTANEGDAREWNDFANVIVTEESINGSEETEYETLDSALIKGLTDKDTRKYLFGGRSFFIYEADDANNLTLVYTSGSELEEITAQYVPGAFNSSHKDLKVDNRSGKKGPEPENVITGVVDGKTFAFVALERVSGIMMYDISDPANAKFVNYINTRSLAMDVEDGEEGYEEALNAAGDLGPEGLDFIPADQSPTGGALLLVANEVSGTVSVIALG